MLALILASQRHCLSQSSDRFAVNERGIEAVQHCLDPSTAFIWHNGASTYVPYLAPFIRSVHDFNESNRWGYRH